MFKNKIFNVVPMLFLLTLTSCNSIKAVHDEQGYTVKVLYDLGDGSLKRNEKTYNELIVYYAPETPIADISTISEYSSISKTGYTLEGWYFDSSFTNKIDFDTYVLDKDTTSLTLYANWKEIINTYFEVYYTDLSDGGKNKLLGKVDYSVGKEFTLKKSKISYPDNNNTYTCVGLYTDKEMTIKVDGSYTLSEEDNGKKIYSKWIEGNYQVISEASDFKKYYGNANLYIDNDLDFTGITFVRQSTLNGKSILGNNHKLTNITCSIDDTSEKNNYVTGLFTKNLTNSTIKDLIIENATYTVKLVLCKKFYLGGIAGTITNSTIENVKISANITFEENTITKYTKENLSIVNRVGYEENDLTSNNNEVIITSNLGD